MTSFIPLPYRQTAPIPSPATAGTQLSGAQEAEAEAAAAEATEPLPNYSLPKPRTAFALFVDHPKEFIVFLEACLEQKDIEEADRKDLYTTLFEMYLETASATKAPEKEVWEAKAKTLIDGKDVRRSCTV